MNKLQAELNATGVRWLLYRGQEMVDGQFVHRVVHGVPVSLTRRRYSNATFCWAEAYIGGQWVSLGDPWQKVTPSLMELSAEVRMRLPVESVVTA